MKLMEIIVELKKKWWGFWSAEEICARKKKKASQGRTPLPQNRGAILNYLVQKCFNFYW